MELDQASHGTSESTSEQQSRDLKHKYVPRATQACTICKRKKIKCDEGRPTCSPCKKRGYNCAYGEMQHRARPDDVLVNQVIQSNEVPRYLSSQTVNTFEHYSPSNEHSAGMIETNRSNLVGRDKDVRSAPVDVATSQVASNITTAATTGQNKPLSGLIPVEGTNDYTKGKEFYGTSSNLSLLNQLINKARSRMKTQSKTVVNGCLDPEQIDTGLSEHEEGPDVTLRLADGNFQRGRLLKDGQFSLVNLLSDEDVAIPDPEPLNDMGTPISSPNAESSGSVKVTTGRSISHLRHHSVDTSPASQYNVHVGDTETDRSRSISYQVSAFTDSNQIEMQLEREYIRIFFDNLHYIHPILSYADFITKCECDIWTDRRKQNERRQNSHFSALYYAIVAVGALTAGRDVLETLRSALGERFSDKPSGSGFKTPDSIDLSKTYFARAKRALGDYFEVCSLEGVQALMFMSLYSQNALKPHACYMYSGMAVRSALAIGLPDENQPQSTKARGEAQRTWWAVYSQEVDMCCSSGRRSSLVEPGSYRISFPTGEVHDSVTPINMIIEMARFAAILLRISLQLYYGSVASSEHDKHRIACGLDTELLAWKSSLPSWLNSVVHPFTEPEWAGKQRLVLQLRFYNARILIHRPLIAVSEAQSSDELHFHTAKCLESARKTIELLYEAYTHRHYFRTWYYNATYTLYASMLVLYVILTENPHTSRCELIRDVEKSLEILHAMDNIKVARRCANLILEVLEVAKTQQNETPTSPYRKAKRTKLAANVLSRPEFQHYSGIQPNAPNDQSFNINTDLSNINLLASLVDPSTLEGFASETSASQPLMFDGDWSTMASGSWTNFDFSQNFFTE